MPVGQTHLAPDDVFELFEQVLASRITDIFPVGHKPVQTAVPLTDVFPCGSLDENDHLQGNFEQQQKGLNALGRVQINRLDAQWPLGTAIDMLAFVLFLMGQHGIFDAQVLRFLIGQQWVVATTGKRLLVGILIKVKLYMEMILDHRQSDGVYDHRLGHEIGSVHHSEAEGGRTEIANLHPQWHVVQKLRKRTKAVQRHKRTASNP